MLRAIAVIPVFLFLILRCYSQEKLIHAVKVSQGPRIDGQLSDPVWKQAEPGTGFITSSPSYGQPAADSTVVRIIYDNSAIYIGAYLYDDPDQIRKQFTPRDKITGSDVDYFSVFIDSYKDRQNAFQFLVTTRNVQTDARITPNIPSAENVYGEISWDAVWESQVSMQPDGWTVEIRIPLFSLRFSGKKISEWGIQFMRFNRRRSETAFWSPVNPNMDGFANQFGTMDGLDHLLPPLRLSFSPYISGGHRETPALNHELKNETLASGGMDIKYGLNESFTLDATLIPDFGQVLSDNVVNNISPFEIQFRENRQFFTEGTELFNKADLFYSRRIGQTPLGYQQIIDSVGTGTLAGYDIIRNPRLTRLYNAVKFSGRTSTNLGIGVFNAVARSEKARIRNRFSGGDSSILTEDLTNYNVVVLDQLLKNRSYITFTNTNVMRSGTAPDANVTGIDFALYDRKNRFELLLQPRYSKIFDAAGGYDGYRNYAQLGKVSGRLQYSLSNEIKSARYDPNDLGFLLSPNEFRMQADVSYNLYDERKVFLNQRYYFSASQSYLYQPFEYQKTEFLGIAEGTFRSLWTLNVELGALPFWSNDYFELQTPSNVRETPRQKLRRAPYYFFFVGGTTDNRKKLFLQWRLGGAEGPLPDNSFYYIQMEPRFRFSDRFTLSAGFYRQQDNGQFGYSFNRTENGEPLLARRQYTDVTSVISGIYNFTSRMNLTFRARHFWNRILNTNIYEVDQQGDWTERFDLQAPAYNVNYNVFNLDVFYTWDFRLGSRIILAWKNGLGQDYEGAISGMDHKGYFNNARRVLQIPHGNEVTIRFIYFLDYQQFKRK